MWDLYLEWCAEMFGATVRSRLGSLVVFGLALFGVGLFLSMEWGFVAWLVPAVIVVSASLAARRVVSLRDDLWRCVWEVEPRASVGAAPRGRTARALAHLRDAVRALTSGDTENAERLAVKVDRRLLRPEEAKLLEVVRSAATSSPPATRMDRALVASAWSEPDELARVEVAFARSGGGASVASKLLRVRLDRKRIAEVAPSEARELLEEARAVGDEELADELDARAREGAYR